MSGSESSTPQAPHGRNRRLPGYEVMPQPGHEAEVHEHPLPHEGSGPSELGADYSSDTVEQPSPQARGNASIAHSPTSPRLYIILDDSSDEEQVEELEAPPVPVGATNAHLQYSMEQLPALPPVVVVAAAVPPLGAHPERTSDSQGVDRQEDRQDGRPRTQAPPPSRVYRGGSNRASMPRRRLQSSSLRMNATPLEEANSF